jgi:hypothetical protein
MQNYNPVTFLDGKALKALHENHPHRQYTAADVVVVVNKTINRFQAAPEVATNPSWAIFPDCAAPTP